MKLLRMMVLLSVIPVLAFGQRGGGGSRGGGGGARGGGGFVGGFRGNTIVRGGNRFVGNGRFFGDGRFFGNGPFFGGRFFSPGLYFGFGYGGYPYSYPYPYDPSYYDPYAYGPSYYDGGYDYGSAGYVAAPAPAAPPQAPTVINQSIGTGTASGSFYRAADYYLIAFNDHTIRAVLSYTVEGDQIRYTTREHEDRTAPLSSVDVRFSEQINRDRRVEFRLP